MALKKHDFVEVEYTGRLDDNTVFDTTDAKTAKEAGIERDPSRFGPAIICLGEGHILQAIDDSIIEKGLGSFTIALEPEKAFGKKNAKLLKLIPMKVFKKENLNPFPGLEVNIDNMYGIIRAVSGGRVIVDFNHPLSGKSVTYDVKVNKVIDSGLDKVKAVFKNELNIADIKISEKEGKIFVEENIPEPVFEAMKKRILELIPEIKEIGLIKKEQKKEEPAADKAPDKKE